MTHSSETKLQQSTPRLAATTADGTNAGLRPPRHLVPVIAGLAIIAVGFGGFVTWASTAPLVSAAVAPGIVAVDGKRRVVEHLEGGYVHDILVREGDRVVMTLVRPSELPIAGVLAAGGYDQNTDTLVHPGITPSGQPALSIVYGADEFDVPRVAAHVEALAQTLGAL